MELMILNLLKGRNNIINQKNLVLKLRFSTLALYCPNLAEELFSDFNKVICMLNSSLAEFVQKLYKKVVVVNIRVCELPFVHYSIPYAEKLGRLITLSGYISKTENTKVLEFQKTFKCNKCLTEFVVQNPIDLCYSGCKPMSCGNKLRACYSSSFSPVHNVEPKYKNYQEVMLQEHASKSTTLRLPRSISIVLEDELTDLCNPGDSVIISGLFLVRHRPPLAENRMIGAEFFIQAQDVFVCSSIKENKNLKMDNPFNKFWSQYIDNRLLGRNVILRSFCPQLHGMYAIKLSIALVLVGGNREEKNGQLISRGESHLLLIGDPGTGKSQLLKYACKIMPRSVFTTGTSSTGVGLTAAAVKDRGGDWSLQPGALIASNGSVCCIDEIGRLGAAAKDSLLETMEQQTISVAKAGMVSQLKTRTTVIATLNPKVGKSNSSHGNNKETLSGNLTGLTSPLLSRFDLIMSISDKCNKNWDELLASHLLNARFVSSKNGNQIARNKITRIGNCILEATAGDRWSIDMLTAYVRSVRKLTPTMTEKAILLIQAYFDAQRNHPSRNLGRTTYRLLQSLTRLSQAHAKLLMRDEVVVQDAVVAICLMDTTMAESALLPPVDLLLTVFPKDAQSEYTKQVQMLISVELAQDILTEELSDLHSIT